MLLLLWFNEAEEFEYIYVTKTSDKENNMLPLLFANLHVGVSVQ